MTVTAEKLGHDHFACDYCGNVNCAAIGLLGDDMSSHACEECAVKIVKAVSSVLAIGSPRLLKELTAFFSPARMVRPAKKVRKK